jgi:hypothetical protein
VVFLLQGIIGIEEITLMEEEEEEEEVTTDFHCDVKTQAHQ